MKRVLPIIIVILLIIGVGGGVVWSILAGRYKPTEEVMDYAAEMGLSENEYAITLNQEVLKEDRAVAIDGRFRMRQYPVQESEQRSLLSCTLQRRRITHCFRQHLPPGFRIRFHTEGQCQYLILF